MKQIIILLFSLCSIVAFDLKGQTRVWLGVQEQFQLKNDFQVRLFQELRFQEFFKKYDRTLFEIGLQKNLAKSSSIAIPLRYTTVGNNENGFEEFRIGLQAAKNVSLTQSFGLSFRTFYQVDYRWAYTNHLFQHWRNKIDFVQKWHPKWQSKIENEIWLQTQENASFDRLRINFSNQISLSELNTLNVGYFVEGPLDQPINNWVKTILFRFQHQF